MRLLIVDQLAQRTRDLQARLKAASDMLLAGTTTSPVDAVEAAAHSDVVLLHQDENREPGRKLIRTLAVNYPHVKVLVVGVQEEEWDEILPYLEAGAAGYITASELANGAGESQPLLEKIRASYRGEALISAQVAALVMRRIAQLAQANERPGVLLGPDSTRGSAGISAD